MPLPELIEIVPWTHPVRAEITVPGSKSITNRALVLAALADGETVLRGALWSEDTQVMVECLQDLGYMVNVDPDPEEFCNRTITVYGQGGQVPRGGTEARPLELFVGNAGTAARFLAAMVCLGRGVYRLQGVARMHERPQASLFQALRQLGCRIDSANDKLPAQIHGSGPHPGQCRVSIEESSQFASALLLSAGPGRWRVEVVGENAEESPYVAMTSKLIAAFPARGKTFQIEPDCSSGSYFWAATGFHLLDSKETASENGRTREREWTLKTSVKVAHWPVSGWQIDEGFWRVFAEMELRSARLATEIQGLASSGSDATPNAPAPSQPGLVISRRDDLGDSIMTAMVLAPLLTEPVRFADLGRLRVQECERVWAMRTELTRCGARVVEEGDTLTVYPSSDSLCGAEIETYQDHRMAMCFAILGLKIPGIKIKNPGCVKKTFPNFFQKLNAPAPRGLGVRILDGATNRPLSGADLFAE
jgi:3-phosphoshikimate 1-carboxyvinyltransferase